jgi:hypothetical protein
MKKVFHLFLLLISASVFSQEIKYKPVKLKGYILMYSYDSSIMSNCGIDLDSIKRIYGYGCKCGDGNIYKNIGPMLFIPEESVKKDSLDYFPYRCSVQDEEHYIFMTTNKNALLEISEGDSAILNDTTLVNAIASNIKTAISIQNRLVQLDIDYGKFQTKWILIKARFKVLAYSEKIEYKNRDIISFRKNPYLLIYDPWNEFTVIKVLDIF